MLTVIVLSFLHLVLQVTKQLGGVVQGLDKVLASMDLEKVRKCVQQLGEIV